MAGGAFTPATREAILDAGSRRCAGCRTGSDLQTHHRAPRRMGGTNRQEVGQPHNGVALCPACHAWAESHRDAAGGLGWILSAPAPAAPYWTETWGWCAWTLLPDPDTWCVRTFLPLPDPGATPSG